MEDAELQRRMDEMGKKLDAIYVSAEKTRVMFLWTLIIAAVAFVLPLIGLVFAIPAFLSSYSSVLTL